jgi:O-succinylbenzoate synthase
MCKRLFVNDAATCGISSAHVKSIASRAGLNQLKRSVTDLLPRVCRGMAHLMNLTGLSTVTLCFILVFVCAVIVIV